MLAARLPWSPHLLTAACGARGSGLAPGHSLQLSTAESL